jgi:glycosyltransferase involved in cell wall biosynthesis
VREGIEGFVVNPGSVMELAGCVEHFLQHPEAVSQMGAAARSRAEEFTWPRFRSLVGDIMSGILNPPLPRVAGAYV